VNLHVFSNAGAPNVTVTGPGGITASTASLPLGRAVKDRSFMLARIPALNETFIVPLDRAAGTYRITTIPGSPAISRIEQLDGVAPSIKVHVVGAGTHRAIVYAIRREPGQLVRFFEVSPQVDGELGTTTGEHGSIAFTATPGTGRRLIIAEIFIGGAPDRRLTVASYEPPTRTSLGRVRDLRVTRSGGRVTITFHALRARAYALSLNLADRARLATITQARHVVFGPVFLELAGKLTIRALGDGVNTLNGLAQTAAVPAAVKAKTPATKRRSRA
jgi:hypothetical protein